MYAGVGLGEDISGHAKNELGTRPAVRLDCSSIHDIRRCRDSDDPTLDECKTSVFTVTAIARIYLCPVSLHSCYTDRVLCRLLVASASEGGGFQSSRSVDSWVGV